RRRPANGRKLILEIAVDRLEVRRQVHPRRAVAVENDVAAIDVQWLGAFGAVMIQILVCRIEWVGDPKQLRFGGGKKGPPAHAAAASASGVTDNAIVCTRRRIRLTVCSGSVRCVGMPPDAEPVPLVTLADNAGPSGPGRKPEDAAPKNRAGGLHAVHCATV